MGAWAEKLSNFLLPWPIMLDLLTRVSINRKVFRTIGPLIHNLATVNCQDLTRHALYRVNDMTSRRYASFICRIRDRFSMTVKTEFHQGPGLRSRELHISIIRREAGLTYKPLCVRNGRAGNQLESFTVDLVTNLCEYKGGNVLILCVLYVKIVLGLK